MNWTSLENKTYTPYSGKPKTCIIESSSGNYFSGTRVENISYPLTIPAIQAACCICLSEGETPSKVFLKNKNLDQLQFWIQEFDLEIIETETLPAIEPENLFHQDNGLFDSFKRLEQLLNQAVVPQSDFPVSALLFVKDGFFEGVNIEVSDWTKGLCAERVAISKAIAAGYNQFNSIEVHTRKGEVSSPCGACRQVITEHLPYHKMKLYHADGSLSEHLTVDLLPFSFKSTSLKE